MRINSIELYGFTRFSLNNFKRFKYTPQEIIQLILGTNMSGKSSLISELSPLPANGQFYTKDGFKEISITYNGHDYVLRSSFSTSGQKHSFVQDGEELNIGETITVQEKLVKQIFHYDYAIHRLLTGLEKFSQMQPTTRREWFTRMHPTSYDYAMSVYNRVKERSRDTSGALKLEKKRLVTEIAKIVGPKEIERLQLKIDALHKEIDYLYQARESQDHTAGQLHELREQVEQDLIKHCRSLFSIKGYFADKVMWLPDEYNIEIESKRADITRTKTQMDLLVKEHNALAENLKAFEKTGGSSVEELRTRLEALQRDKTALLDTQSLKLIWSDPEASLAALNGVYELLSDTLSTLPENRERKYSQAVLLDTREKELAVREALGKAQEQLEKLRHSKEHLESLKRGEQTECPQCRHRWTIGYTEEGYNRIVKAIDVGTTFTEEQTKIQKHLLDLMVQNQEYGDKYRDYARCVRTVPVLNPLWDYLLQEDYVSNAPKFALTQVNLALRDLGIVVQANQIQAEIGKTNDLLQLAIRANDADMGKLSTRLEKIDEELGYLTKGLTRSTTILNDLINEQARVREFLKLEERIREFQQQYTSHTQSLVKAVKNEIITDCLRQLQFELAQQQNYLNDIQAQNTRVHDIEVNIDKLTRQDEALKLLVQTLSPTEGLIAEGLLGFVRGYLRRMNKIVKNVWTYPMEILDCNNNPDSADLDWRFPIRIQDTHKPIDDVKIGSEGAQEIMNIAFRIVAAHALGLKDWPLYFDEPGAHLDKAHKLAIPRLIQALIEQTNVSQVFIISHDYNQYAAISNCDVCVVNPANIVVPTQYNQQVETA